MNSNSKVCQAEGCARKYYALGYCHKHYSQFKKYGELIPKERERKSPYCPGAKCQAPNCNKPARALGYCTKHWRQVHKYGRLVPEREKDPDRGCIVKGCDQKHQAKGLCKQHYMKQWREKNRLSSLYGIINETKEDMYDKQNECCAICKNSFGIDGLVIDHDHVTGKVRGLLCPLCNSGLGWFKDDPDRCREAANYLEAK